MDRSDVPYYRDVPALNKISASAGEPRPPSGLLTRVPSGDAFCWLARLAWRPTWRRQLNRQLLENILPLCAVPGPAGSPLRPSGAVLPFPSEQELQLEQQPPGHVLCRLMASSGALVGAHPPTAAAAPPLIVAVIPFSAQACATNGRRLPQP